MITRRHWSWPSRVAVILALAIITLSPMNAAAHERRAIADGQAQVVVGWLTEPTLVNQPNGIDLRVTNPATNEPIEGLEKTVKVEVTHGGTSKTMDLRARFGQPGAYTADIIPTSTGDYTFRFVGEINGATINEVFESGPGRFNAVQPLSTVQFPAAQPGINELHQELMATRATADTARTAAFAGLGVGLLGVLLAGGALLALRGRSRAASQPATNPRA